jgi:ribosomal protein S6--L-glutamate ligase
MVQEYIKEAGGADIRCFVVGGKVVAAMRRQSDSPEEFRSNLHRGGIATAVEITEEERNMAIRSAQIIGLNVAGVDIVQSNRGPLIMEVNASPGLEGIEKTTGIDVASEIIKFIETGIDNSSKGKERQGN